VPLQVRGDPGGVVRAGIAGAQAGRAGFSGGRGRPLKSFSPSFTRTGSRTGGTFNPPHCGGVSRTGAVGPRRSRRSPTSCWRRWKTGRARPLESPVLRGWLFPGTRIRGQGVRDKPTSCRHKARLRPRSGSTRTGEARPAIWLAAPPHTPPRRGDRHCERGGAPPPAFWGVSVDRNLCLRNRGVPRTVPHRPALTGLGRDFADAITRRSRPRVSAAVRRSHLIPQQPAGPSPRPRRSRP